MRCNKRKTIGYIILTYPCRSIEWLHLRKLFAEVLIQFDHAHLVPLIEEVMFAWKYHAPLSTVLYKPSLVFKKISFLELLDSSGTCECLSIKRFAHFLDPRTLLETSSFANPQVHVRTVDTGIIQHLQLRSAVAKGLNHVPPRPTSKLSACMATVMEAFEQLVEILGLHSTDFPLEQATHWFWETTLSKLKQASHSNLFGFRSSGPDLLSLHAVKDELRWLTSHLYCAGLDKASNNVCFVCIRHIRFMALERLSGSDFSPRCEGEVWLLPSHVLRDMSSEISNLLPEVRVSFEALPYLMATYKLHKNKYRWLTNAFQTVYSNLAHLLTIATMLVLEQVRIWASDTTNGFSRFMRCNSSFYWLVNSSIEVALNLPNKIYNIFVAHITRCYESIPLDGDDNLIDAVSHIIRIGYRQAKKHHPRSTPQIWIRVNAEGHAAHAQWSSSKPAYGDCFVLPAERLISLHCWLIRNCNVQLGDRVWKQTLGIPMGFSCSPLWCNVYLLHYEIQFMLRLAKLGRSDIMQQFKSAFRYIDDLCWINVEQPLAFLSPSQPKLAENPYWVYPLNVLEIKNEVTRYALEDPTRGVHAHFMNLDIVIEESGSGEYSTCKYDKRRDLPFSYSQYIMFDSNRPIKQSYSVAVSQTVPILYLSSSMEAALKEILILISTMVKNGFQERRLRHLISTFMGIGTFPGIKFDIQELISRIRY